MAGKQYQKRTRLTIILPRGHGWQATRQAPFDMRDAACRDGAWPGTFDIAAAEHESRLRRDAVAAAVACCQGCPLIEPCGAYALSAGESWGIWGGLTPADRKRAARNDA